MEYRTLGRTEERVSVLGFGGTGVGIKNYLSVWDPEQQTDASQALAAVEAAIDRGINFIDCANTYGPADVRSSGPGQSERILQLQGLADRQSALGGRQKRA